MSFELEKSPQIIQIRGKDIMWQKERMLNLALKKIPHSFKKIAWLDCDILFKNLNWGIEASELLEKYPVVQLFEEVRRLPKDLSINSSMVESWKSFARVYVKHPNLCLFSNFTKHGHTGFAWAIRKDILLRNGLYDVCIAGSGDHLMAHSFSGDWDSPHVLNLVQSKSHLIHFQKWSEKIYQDIKARMYYISGTILHLWHGDMENRNYFTRNKELGYHEFDPKKDIKVGVNGLWEWNSDKPQLHNWAINYFNLRKEDEN